MKSRKEEKREREEEIERFRGREDFPDSTTSPKNEDNTVPLYVVLWMDRKRNRRTGNSWGSKINAQQTMERVKEDGRFICTMTCYVAGFAF